jgi:tripartite-type tricarboxylate transporter receptor subunit TctC
MRIIASIVMGLTVAGWAATAQAQNYPTRPIRVIVSIAAGSVTDVIMRASAADLGPRLGQNLVIENRGGANGIPAADACAKAAPDGYTLCLLNHGQLSINPVEFAKLPYNADSDLVPIAHLYFLIEGVFVPASLGVNSVADLKAMAKAKSGSLNYGTLGAGSFPDLFLQWLNHEWGTKIVGIPYRGGGPIAQATAAGQLQLAKMGVGNFIGPMQAGKVKAIAVAAPKSVALLPGVPTLAEAGIPFPSFGWWGLFAPKGTPKAIVDKLATDFVAQTKNPKFVAFLESKFVVPSGMGAAEFAVFLKADRERAKGLLALSSHGKKEYKPPQKK